MKRVNGVQEAPYLYANGSGYMAQVMRRVSEAFRAQNDDAGVAFDVVPVHTWQQLVARARTSRWVSVASSCSQQSAASCDVI